MIVINNSPSLLFGRHIEVSFHNKCVCSVAKIMLGQTSDKEDENEKILKMFYVR